MRPRLDLDPYPDPEAEPRPEVATVLLMPLYRLPADEPGPTPDRQQRVRRLRLLLGEAQD